MDEFVHNRHKTVPLTGYLRQGGYVFGSIVLFVCLLATLHKKFLMDFREIFVEGGEWATKQMISFGRWSVMMVILGKGLRFLSNNNNNNNGFV